VKSRRVLIVEDEADLAHLTARILRENKIKVIVKTTGREAIRYLETSETPVDVLILDLRLPDVNGLEVIKRCRALDKPLDGVKIAVVSAFGSVEVRNKALKLGADGFFDKPIKIEVLLDFVQNTNGVEQACPINRC
jgi:DNA-binding response OmpR family regulator